MQTSQSLQPNGSFISYTGLYLVVNLGDFEHTYINAKSFFAFSFPFFLYRSTLETLLNVSQVNKMFKYKKKTFYTK